MFRFTAVETPEPLLHQRKVKKSGGGSSRRALQDGVRIAGGFRNDDQRSTGAARSLLQA
jgi:hypothetical protein